MSLPFEQQLKVEYYKTRESANKLYRRLKNEYNNQDYPRDPTNDWKGKVTQKQIEQFIQRQRVGQTFQQPSVKRAGFYPIRTFFSDRSHFTRVMIDLMDVSSLSPQQNGGVHFLFCAVDVYCRYAFVFPQKTKSAKDCMHSLLSMYKGILALDHTYHMKGGWIPRKEKYMELISDDESAWKTNTAFNKFCSTHDIHQTLVKNDYKRKSVVESFIRYFRRRIVQFLSAENTHRYITHLQQLVNDYNTSYHSTIRTTPEQALVDNTKYEMYIVRRLNRLNNKSINKKMYSGLSVGDLVRVSTKANQIGKLERGAGRSIFSKEDQGWTDQIYTIESIDGFRFQLKNPHTQTVYNDALFRRNELLKVNASGEERPEEQKEEEQKESVRAQRQAYAQGRRVVRRTNKNLGIKKGRDRPGEESLLNEMSTPLSTRRQQGLQAQIDVEQAQIEEAKKQSLRGGKIKKRRVYSRFTPY
jgi:hypothetical protein